MTHVLAALFLLAVMAACLHLIAATIGDHWRDILQALAGEAPIAVRARPICIANFANFGRPVFAAARAVRRLAPPLRLAA